MNLSESHYRGLVEAAPDALVGITEHGQIVLVNMQTEALFGYDRDDLIGEGFELLVPTSGALLSDRLREAYLSQGGPGRLGAAIELTGRRRDGTEFPAEISFSAVSTEDGPMVSAAIRDGTERRQAAIISSSNDAIISLDLNGAITSWNPGAEALHGFAPSEVLGHHITELVPDSCAEELQQLLAWAIAGQRIIERETVRRRADGSEFDVAESMAPLLDEDGVVMGISNIARDITERKRLRRERQALTDRLHQSERLESLGQLAGGVAHDFNNLLSVILNYATFAANELDADDPVRADVDEIRSAAERAARLTHQLLLFGRREASQRETLDLDELVAEAETLLSRTIGEHIELVVHRSAHPMPIRSDRGQVEQVLLNLVVNARDAMPDGGVVNVETAEVFVDEESRALHPDLDAGAYIRLSVSDTGSGMDADTIAHAFEPFFTTKPKGEGTGLGLATVYGIVAEGGGSIGIYSELGIGTTIRVYFPIASTPQAPRPASAGGHERTRTETVLLVDDDAAIRRVTTRILERNGYRVIQASDGPTALELAAHVSFDLLLTDVVMPLMSGRELADRLRRDRPGLRTLFMSGYSKGVLGPQRGLDEGISLIQKPFSERDLVECVDSLLESAAD